MRSLFIICAVLLMTGVIVNCIDDDVDTDDIDIDEQGEEFGEPDDMDNLPFDDGEKEPLKIPKERPVYTPPVPTGPTYFYDAFISESEFKRKWVLSKAKKDGADEAIAKYDGKWSIEEPTDNPLKEDLGLVLTSKAKHHAVSAKLDKPFEFSGKPFVVQYEVKFQNGQECGGAYIKLLTKTDKLDLNQFTDKSGYTIMFGPDKCGNDNKLHFIFRHKNPKTGAFEEKHAKKPSASIDKYFTDKRTHLYTLVVKPDNTFEVYVDQNLVNSGSLLEDMTPPVNPPKEIKDPEDKKPEDWDERERIPDPESTKPDDWDESEPKKIVDTTAVKPDGWLDDEPELIPDENSEKPSDWDEEMDGEWEPAQITNPKCEAAPGCGEWKAPEMDNPKYKGKWNPPMIDNPNYKGKWSPRMIANPDFFEDDKPYEMTAIGAIGLELWSMSDGILFDNFIVADSKKTADDFAAISWELKQEQESFGASDGGVWKSVIDATNEHPWLWAVIIVVIVLPIVLIVVCCCVSKGDDDAAAQRKKTDEPTEDVIDDETEEQEEEEKNSTEHQETFVKKPSKASLETPSDASENGPSKAKGDEKLGQGDEK